MGVRPEGRSRGVGGGFQKRQNVGRDTKSTVTVMALAPLGDAVIQRLQNS